MTSPYRIPIPDENGRLKDKHLPERLSSDRLGSEFVSTEVGPHPELFGVQAAMAVASREPVDVVTYGDSLWEGFGATSGERRFHRRLQAELNRRFATGVEPGDVFLPTRMSSNVPNPSPFWTVTGTPGMHGQGPGGRSAKLNAGVAFEGTFSGTQFRFFFYRLAADQVRFVIDGTTTDWTVPIVTGVVQQVWTSPVLDAGDHTIRVEFLAGGAIFAGMERVSDVGIRVWDFSLSGMSAEARTTSANGTSDFANWLGLAVTPKLILLPLLTNDTPDSTAAEYETNLQACVDLIRTKSSAPILIVPNWGPVERAHVDPWRDYVDAARRVAEGSDRCAFHDLNKFVDDPGGDPHGIHHDSVHLNDRGQAIHARLVADAVTLGGGSEPSVSEALTKTEADATYAPVSEVPEAYQQYVAANASGMQTSVEDAVGEWWIWPLATYDAKRNRTIGGGLSADRGDGRANVVVWERNHGTGKVHRYVIGDAPVDDHNVPSVLLLPDGAVLVTWNYHNVDQILRCKLSNRSGDLRTLVSAPEVTFNIGHDLSYTQAHLIAGDASSATFTVWQFVRLYRGDGWAWEIVPMTINNNTRALTKGSTLRFLSGGTNQAYAATAYDPTSKKIRVMAGYNPAASRNELHAFEVDPQTGAVTSLADPALSANVLTQTGVPITMVDATPAIPDPGAGKSRRIFYPRPGPAEWAIAYADWDTAAPDAGMYKLAVGNPGAADTVNGLSVNAGYASTPKGEGWNTAAGIEFKTVVTMGGPIPGDREVGRRYVSASDRQFTCRITSSGFIKVNLTRAGNNAAEYLSSVVVPDMFTKKVGVGFRWRNDGTDGVIEFITSADGGATWTTLGETATTGTYATIDESTAPLVAGSNVESFQTPMLIHSTRYSTWDGTTATPVAAVSWDTLPGNTSSGYTDPQGNVWTLSGDADVKSTTASSYSWNIHDVAPTGPRVGYTPLANYIGGMGFRTPCHSDDPVLVTRRDTTAGKSYVEEHYLVNGQWVSEQIDESDDYLSRPSRPVNGGPLRSVHTEFTNYTDQYTEYQGNLRTV